MFERDAERRRQILEAAIPVFAAHGLKGATVRLVGRQAGVNSALIYYYFTDKEALFRAAVRRVLQDFLDGVALKRPPFKSGADRVRFLVDAVFDYYEGRPDRLRLMSLMFVHHGDVMGGIIAEAMRAAPLAPVAIVEEGLAAGQLRAPSALQAWWSILGACMFTLHVQNIVSHMAALKPAPRIPRAAGRRSAIIDLLTHGLAVTRKGRKA